ncbi:MAG: NAD(P)H-hydrate dehydratase [Bacillota bacterium]|nr:NAD(P)H-hydrate dehydratase [Bacillota bacterium]
MKLITNKEMKILREIAINEYGIPSVVLMENAARSVCDEILKIKQEVSRVIILCGVDNNGGYGFALGRQLFNENVKIEIVIVGDPKKIQGDSLINLEILRKMNIKIESVNDIGGINRLKNIVTKYDILIDAISAIEIEEIKDTLKLLIEAVNGLENDIISIDIPTGVDGNTGKIKGVAINANMTIVLMLPKFGNILYPGAEYCGKLIIKNTGITPMIIDKLNLTTNVIEKKEVRENLPLREKNSHKGMFGRGVIVAGSIGLSGAAILTCRSALRAGIGLIELFVPESIDGIISSNVTEVITCPLKETRKGVIGINSISDIIKGVKRSDVISIGPGCGNTNELFEIVKQIILESEKPVIIDADGLNVLSRNIEILKDKKAKIILTPHIGEMSRLTGLSADEINENKIEIVKKFAKEYGVILVLKSARTVIGFPNGKIYININGNSGMATAGAGDVLTGIITSLVAQGVEPEKSVIIGVFIHGYTGDLMAEKFGEYGLVAEDIIRGISKVFKELTQ